MGWDTFVMIAAVLGALSATATILDKLYVYGKPALLKLKKRLFPINIPAFLRRHRSRDLVIDTRKLTAPVTFSPSDYKSVKLIYKDRVVNINKSRQLPVAPYVGNTLDPKPAYAIPPFNPNYLLKKI